MLIVKDINLVLKLAILQVFFCTKIFKQTIDYYVNRGSHVFCSFIDFNKAFDSVNYWKLFNKLLNDNTDANVAGTLAYWYSNQQICVRWLDSTSNYFTTGNGLGKAAFCPHICLQIHQ